MSDVPIPNNNMIPIQTTHNNRETNNALEVRRKFTFYFNGAGAVSWQNGSAKTQ